MLVMFMIETDRDRDIVEIEHMIVEFVLNSFQCPENMSRRGCKTSFMVTNRNKPRHHRASNPLFRTTRATLLSPP